MLQAVLAQRVVERTWLADAVASRVIVHVGASAKNGPLSLGGSNYQSLVGTDLLGRASGAERHSRSVLSD